MQIFKYSIFKIIAINQSVTGIGSISVIFDVNQYIALKKNNFWSDLTSKVSFVGGSSET